MYNRRPNITKYKTYDIIYFIAPNPNDVIEDIEKLENLFENHKSMKIPNKTKINVKTDLISIKMKTTNLSDDVFTKYHIYHH